MRNMRTRKNEEEEGKILGQVTGRENMGSGC
jgi:hypothetical protein